MDSAIPGLVVWGVMGILSVLCSDVQWNRTLVGEAGFTFTGQSGSWSSLAYLGEEKVSPSEKEEVGCMGCKAF